MNIRMVMVLPEEIDKVMKIINQVERGKEVVEVQLEEVVNIFLNRIANVTVIRDLILKNRI